MSSLGLLGILAQPGSQAGLCHCVAAAASAPSARWGRQTWSVRSCPAAVPAHPAWASGSLPAVPCHQEGAYK